MSPAAWQPWIALAELAWMTGLGFAALGWGGAILDRLRLEPFLAAGRRALALGLGAALASYATFAVCAAGLLHDGVLAGLQAGFVLGGLWLWRRKARPAGGSEPASGGPWMRLLQAALALLAAANLLPALAPAVDWDGLAYHLALPAIYRQAGGFVFRPDIFHNLFPQFTEMLYLWGLLFPFGAAAKLVHYTFGLLAAAGVYAACRRSGLTSGAWLGALIFYAQYLVHVASGTAFVELAGAACVALALVAWLEAGRDLQARTPWLGLTFFFLGCYAATKWHGLILLALAVPAWLADSRARGLPVRPAQALAVAAGGVLPLLPYLLRAWILGGNPVWPLAYTWFGGREWDAGMAARVGAFVHGFAGLRPGPWGFLCLPYDLLRHGGAFGVGAREAALPLLGGAVLLTAAWWPGRREGNTGWLRRLACVLAAVLYLAVWFAASPQVRFLLPLLPLAAWAAALGLARVWSRGGAWRWAAAAAGVLLLAVRPPVHHDTLWQARTLAGSVSAAVYCARHLGHFRACQFLNARQAPGERVLLFGENRGFYLRGAYLWGDPLLQRVVDYRRLDTPERLAGRLRGLGVTWLLWRDDLYGPDYLPPPVRASLAACAAAWGEEAYTDGPVRVIRFAWPPPETGRR